MANNIFVSVQEGTEEPEWLSGVEPFLQKVLSALGYDGEEFSVLFCGNEFIQDLNKNYRNIDAPTDVLSFESDSEYIDEDGNRWAEKGDIAVSVPMTETNAAYFNTDFKSELKRLLVHGVLHLNGYDHGEEHLSPGVAPSCRMLVLQEELLEKFSEEEL